MKQIVDNDQAMHLIKLNIEARTIGELIEWISKAIDCECCWISLQHYFDKYNISVYNLEMIDALVELAIKIQESK